MEEIVKLKKGSTLQRWQTAIKDKAFDSIRALPLLETQAEQLLRVLEKGTVSTNVHLRKLHNFSMDMNWLPWPVIPKRQWPAVVYKTKRAITLAEHQAIIARETNRERRDFYQLCWHLGASQSDIAALRAEDVDWKNKTISFFRKKTGVPPLATIVSANVKFARSLTGKTPATSCKTTKRKHETSQTTDVCENPSPVTGGALCAHGRWRQAGQKSRGNARHL